MATVLYVVILTAREFQYNHPVASLYTDLTLTAQTAYAQLLDAALAAEHLRSVADLKGSFAAKTVRGRVYWYYQYTEPSGKLRQVYVGPDGEPVQRLMQRKAEPGTADSLQPLARSALALGCAGALPRHYRVIRRLADYGFFAAGGVLVGTHAFLSFANQLGVRWHDAARTQDVDFAHAGKSVSILLPSTVEVRTADAIASLEMGFLPIGALGTDKGAGFLIPREPGFRLDFLTTLHHGGNAPFEHPRLHVTLQPLRFMEFALEGVGQAVLFAEEGAVVVNLPDPARYAIHKLIIAGERRSSSGIKARKDVAQAAHLLAYLWPLQRSRAEAAAEDAHSRGKAWSSRLARGAVTLAAAYPDVARQPALMAALSPRDSGSSLS
ncbi:MAG: nucleotidyltransferase domain-containing protein [Steroidobacteraceae bacterium]|nr:nucleotidyltransferase domain-containing protein [Steroidobacteraceae bacterium]